ncbi:MAG: hypothetical protein ACOY3P_07010 [Planctomycetota bacterium]
MIAAALREVLVGIAAVTDLVGSGEAARIRFDRFVESDTTPQILIEVDDAQRENDLSGRGGLVVAECTVTCRANSRTAADALWEAVRSGGTDPASGLAGYHGTVTAGTVDCVVDDVQTADVPKQLGSDDAWFDAVATVTVILNEVR